MRVRLAQADALIARGHRVRIVTKGLPLTWRSSRAEWIYVDELQQYDTTEDEVVITEPGPLLVEDEFYRSVTPREHDPPRVLLVGPAQTEHKGIDDGYGAVAHARWFHQKLDLIRVSPWAPSREEPLDSVQEFHVALNTAEMVRLVHSCDLLIAPSHASEPLGLSAAEGLAAALPCLLTAIPSYLSFDETRDYAHFGPEQNPVELGERLIELLSDAPLRARLRVRAREVAEQWRAERVVEQMEAWLTGRASTQ